MNEKLEVIEVNASNIALYISPKRGKFEFTHEGVKSRRKHLWMQKCCKVVRRKSIYQGFCSSSWSKLPEKMPPTGEQRRARRNELIDIKI